MEDREDAVIAEKLFLQKFSESRAALSAEEDAVQYRIGSPLLAQHDFEGEVTDWALQYLYAHKCPYNLAAAVAYATCQEIKSKDLQIVAHQNGQADGETVFDCNKLLKLVHWTVHDICERWMATPTKAVLAPTWPVAITAVKNGRRRMEDRHVVISDLGLLYGVECPSPRGFFAVFDGHAGPDAATYAAAHLHHNIVNQPTFVTNIVQAIKDGFQLTDEHFIYKSKQENLKSGSTAVCAIVEETAVHVAWLGDSQAILARQDGILNLVIPHKPERTDERERIESLGGCVILFGTWRVNGTLAVSRAIGDAEFKPYVSAEPDVVSIPRDGTEDFLIVACDGLWDVMTGEDAATIVYAYLVKKPDDLEGAAHKLVQVSVARGSNDNISVIIVLLRDVAIIVSSMSCIPESPPASFRIPLATSESLPEGLKQMIENGESPTKILPMPDIGVDEQFTPGPNTLNPFAPSFTPSSARNGPPDAVPCGDLLNFCDNQEVIAKNFPTAQLPTADPTVQKDEQALPDISAHLWISDTVTSRTVSSRTVTSHVIETGKCQTDDPFSTVGANAVPTLPEFQEYFLAQPESQVVLVDMVSAVPTEPDESPQSPAVQLSSFDSKPVESPSELSSIEASIGVEGELGLSQDMPVCKDETVEVTNATLSADILGDCPLVLPSPPINPPTSPLPCPVTSPPMSPHTDSSPPPIPERPPSSAPPLSPPPAPPMSPPPISPRSMPQMPSTSPPPIPLRSPEIGLPLASPLKSPPPIPSASPPPIPARSPQSISTPPLTPGSPPPQIPAPFPPCVAEATTPPAALAVSPTFVPPCSSPLAVSLPPTPTTPTRQDPISPAIPAASSPAIPAASPPPTSFSGLLPLSSSPAPTPSSPLQVSDVTSSLVGSFESAPPLDLNVQQFLLDSMVEVIPQSVSTAGDSLAGLYVNCLTINCLQPDPVTVELIPETIPVSEDVVDDESEDGEGWRYFQGESGHESQKAKACETQEIVATSLNSTASDTLPQDDSFMITEAKREVITSSITHISLETSMDGICNSSANSSGILEVRPHMFDSSSDVLESSILTGDSSAREDSSPIQLQGNDASVTLSEVQSELLVESSCVDASSNQVTTTITRKLKDTSHTEVSKSPGGEKGTSNRETLKKAASQVNKDTTKRLNTKTATAPPKAAGKAPVAAAKVGTKNLAPLTTKPAAASKTLERKPQAKSGLPPTRTATSSSSAPSVSSSASKPAARPASATMRRETGSTVSRQAPTSKQETNAAGTLPKRPASAGTIPRTAVGSRPLSNGLKKPSIPAAVSDAKSSGDSIAKTNTASRSVSQTKTASSTLKSSTRPPPAKRSTTVPGAKSDTMLIATTANKQTKETVNKQISTTVRQTTKTTVRLTQTSRTTVTGATTNGTLSGSKTARLPGPTHREAAKKAGSTNLSSTAKAPPKKAAPVASTASKKAPASTKPLKPSSSKQAPSVPHAAGTSSTTKGVSSPPALAEKVKENLLSEKGALDEQAKEPAQDKPNEMVNHGDELGQIDILPTNGSAIDSLIGLGSSDSPTAAVVSSQEFV